MTIRARSRRRLLLLLLLVTVVLGGAGGLYVRRESQRDDRARAAREEGLRAYEQGNYSEAVAKLGEFRRRLSPDGLVLLRYAQAIFKLPERGSQHFEAALSALRSCVELEPEDVVARRVLLDVYVQHGLRTEANELSKWFLKRDPSDEQALRAQARTLFGMSRYNEARQLLEGQMKRGVLPLEEHLLYLDIMRARKQAKSDITAHAAKIAGEMRVDPRFRLLLAHAALLAEDQGRARGELLPLVAVAKTDDAFAILLVADLDAAGLSGEALSVLKGLSGEKLDQALQAQLVQRLWWAGEIDSITKFVSEAGMELSALPTPVLGYAAMAWKSRGDDEKANLAAEVLEGRELQSAAKGWVILLRQVILSEGRDLAGRIQACLDSIDVDPSNPQSRLEVGHLYGAAGEVALAIRELRTATSLSHAWAAPAAEAAKLLAQSGRLGDAAQAAQAADAFGSSDPGIALLLTMAESAAQGVVGVTFIERVLQGLKQRGLHGPETRAVRLALLTASRRDNEIRVLVEELLGDSEKPAGDLLLSAASVSRLLDLGLGARCRERYAALYGSTPALALAQSQATASAVGGRLARFRERRSQAARAGSAGWDIAEASLLRADGESEEALGVWRRAVDRNDLAPAQARIILAAQGTWADPDLVQKAVDRLRVSTGESCLWWRYYQARLLLRPAEGDEPDPAEAIAHLRAILEAAPEHRQARLLLAEAYAREGRAKEALDQLVVARGSLARSIGLDLEIARLHQHLGRNTAAHDVMKGVLASGAATSEHLTAVASAFARLGARDTVVELLDRLPDEMGKPAELQRRAELYAAVGKLKRADRLIRRVLATTANDRAILLAASLAEFDGRPEDAATLMGLLEAALPDPLERARSKAAHHRRMGRAAQAEIQLRKVVSLAGAERDDWLGLLACELSQGNSEEVVRTLTEARAQGVLPSSGEAGALSADLLTSVAERPDLRSLGMAYLEELQHRSSAEPALMLLMAAGEVEPTRAVRARLRGLAQSNLGLMALQLAVVDFLVKATDHEDALALARAALARFPASSAPAEALARCHLAMRRPDLAAKAAREWRARATGSSPTLAPDLFLAELSRPKEAVALLEPYVKMAVKEEITRALLLYGAALLGSDRVDQARALLEPLLGQNHAATLTWVYLAGLSASQGETERATLWLKHKALDGDGAQVRDVQIELAAAWQVVAVITGSNDARSASRQHTKIALDKAWGEPTPGEWERVGLILEENGEEEKAEAAYRHALSGGRNRAFALNNLAMLLARTGRAHEALPMASRLVARGPDQPEYRDTLAFVQIQLRDLASALVQYEGCRTREPHNPRWAMRIIEVLLDQRKTSEAKVRLEGFRTRYPTSEMSPDMREAWSVLVAKVAELASSG